MNICVNCKNETTNLKFCSRKCVSLWNNKNRIGTIKSEETRQKISKKLLKNNPGGNYSSTVQNRKNKEKYKEDYNLFRNLNLLNRNNRENQENKGFLKNFEKIKNEDYSNLKFDRLRIRIILDQNHKCKNCGIDKWFDKKVTFEINHIDGNNQNNDPSNLEALCPNCHSLTDNWRGKNIFKNNKKVEDDKLLEALKTSKNIRQALIKVGLTPKGKNYFRCQKLLQDYFKSKS